MNAPISISIFPLALTWTNYASWLRFHAIRGNDHDVNRFYPFDRTGDWLCFTRYPIYLKRVSTVSFLANGCIQCRCFEEVVGFEPTDRVSSVSCFPSRCDRPLCHTSKLMAIDHVSIIFSLRENVASHHTTTFCSTACGDFRDFTRTFVHTSVVWEHQRTPWCPLR